MTHKFGSTTLKCQSNDNILGLEPVYGFKPVAG